MEKKNLNVGLIGYKFMGMAHSSAFSKKGNRGEVEKFYAILD